MNKKFENINYNFKFSHGRITYDNPLSLMMLNESYNLNESLTRTYGLNFLKRYLKEYFKLQDNQIEIYDNENNVDIGVIHIPNNDENVKLMEKALNFCGYFISTKDEFVYENENWISLQFEPKFQENVRDEIKKETPYLIHITPIYNLEKILNNGFEPRSKNKLFNYPNRTFFLIDKAPKSSLKFNMFAKHLARQLCKANTSDGNNGEYAIIRVDIDKIGDVNLYYDPNLEYGCYTRENIVPNSICDYVILKFEKK